MFITICISPYDLWLFSLPGFPNPNRPQFNPMECKLKEMMSQWQGAYLAPRSWLLIPSSNKRNQGFLEKRLILGMGQEICKMRLKHLVVPESKEVLPKQQRQHTHWWGYVKGAQESTERAPNGQSRNNLSNKTKQYWIITSKYKISIHEIILI